MAETHKSRSEGDSEDRNQRKDAGDYRKQNHKPINQDQRETVRRVGQKPQPEANAGRKVKEERKYVRDTFKTQKCFFYIEL